MLLIGLGPLHSAPGSAASVGVVVRMMRACQTAAKPPSRSRLDTTLSGGAVRGWRRDFGGMPPYYGGLQDPKPIPVGLHNMKAMLARLAP